MFLERKLKNEPGRRTQARYLASEGPGILFIDSELAKDHRPEPPASMSSVFEGNFEGADKLGLRFNPFSAPLLSRGRPETIATTD